MMVSIVEMQKYESYKESGVVWVGDIPVGWEVKPGLVAFSENRRNNKGMKESTVLSLSYGRIIIKPEEKLVGLVPESFETYQLVEPNDIIIRCTDLQNDQVSLRTGLAKNKGIITSAYVNLQVKSGFNSRFLHYYLHSLDTTKVLYKFGSGLRQNLSYLDFKRLPVLVIPEKTQVVIADFLDQKTAQIDEAIFIKEQQIALLKERRQIIIQKAITQGLDPNVLMKDSGIDWIGMIPEHWDMKRAKYLLKEINERSETGDEELLSVSHMTGVTPRSEKTVSMFMAEDYTGSKLCHAGDLVINIMWAWMGALGVSDRTGIVSPSYGVFRELKLETFNPMYLELLLKSTKYVEYYNKVSTGLHSSRLRFYGHMLFDMKMGIPPFEEQNKIINHVVKVADEIDSVLLVQHEQITKLKEYKTSLINSAVTGKIKVTPEMVEG